MMIANDRPRCAVPISSTTNGNFWMVEMMIFLPPSIEPEDRGGMNGAAGWWARAALDVLEHGIATQRPGHADG